MGSLPSRPDSPLRSDAAARAEEEHGESAAVWALVWALARTVALREALEAGYCDYALTLASELELELAAAVARCGRPS